MKRDMDLFREILLEAEKVPSSEMWPAEPLLGYNMRDVVAHIELLRDAGLVDTRTRGNQGMILRITNEGHDFLEESRQQTRWETAKSKTKELGVPVTISVLKSILTELINHTITKGF